MGVPLVNNCSFTRQASHHNLDARGAAGGERVTLHERTTGIGHSQRGVVANARDETRGGIRSRVGREVAIHVLDEHRAHGAEPRRDHDGGQIRPTAAERNDALVARRQEAWHDHNRVPRERRSHHRRIDIDAAGADDETGLVRVETGGPYAGGAERQREQRDGPQFAGRPEQVKRRLIGLACERSGFLEQRVGMTLLCRDHGHDWAASRGREPAKERGDLPVRAGPREHRTTELQDDGHTFPFSARVRFQHERPRAGERDTRVAADANAGTNEST